MIGCSGIHTIIGVMYEYSLNYLNVLMHIFSDKEQLWSHFPNVKNFFPMLYDHQNNLTTVATLEFCRWAIIDFSKVASILEQCQVTACLATWISDICLTQKRPPSTLSRQHNKLVCNPGSPYYIESPKVSPEDGEPVKDTKDHQTETKS
jgi:hypothetical protein